jgi:predicted porin
MPIGRAGQSGQGCGAAGSGLRLRPGQGLGVCTTQEDKAAKKLKVMGLAAAFKFGETTVSVGAAQARNVTGAANTVDDARIYTVQASHNLSKRTAVYSHLTAVSNEGSAALGFNSPVAGGSSSGIQFGVRHRF